MKAAFALTVAALLAFTLPAQAQVIIEEAPGAEGASMEPTSYLGTETARILPTHLNVVSLGLGGLLPFNTATLRYARGFGSGGEFSAHVAYFMPIAMAVPTTPGVVSPPAPPPIGGGFGYKQRLAIAGPWDIALNGYGAVATLGVPYYGLQVGLPCTTMLGPGDLTLQPRVTLPDLSNGSNAGTYSLNAGYRLPLGPLRLLFEATGGWHNTGFPAYSGRLGARYGVLPNLYLDGHLALDLFGAGTHLGHPETTPIAGVGLHFAL